MAVSGSTSVDNIISACHSEKTVSLLELERDNLKEYNQLLPAAK